MATGNRGKGTVQMSSPRILIAGVGNIFFGDDAFGVEVVRQLAERPLPGGVRVVDFGIRGLDLTYALLDGYEAVVLVDASRRGGAPGTLYVLEPGPEGPAGPAQPGPMIEMHSLEPQKVLRLARALGSRVERVLLVACEPAPAAADDEMSMEMCEAVRAAVGEAVGLVESLVARLLAAPPAALPERRPSD